MTHIDEQIQTNLISNWKITDEIVLIEEESNPTRRKIHQIHQTHQIQCIRISSIWRDKSCSIFVEMLIVSKSNLWDETGYAQETTGGYTSRKNYSKSESINTLP